MWTVLKFGGTSVSSLERWQTIAGAAAELLDKGDRVVLVCSALSGISDALERLLVEAQQGEFEASLQAIEQRHQVLADELGVEVDELKPWHEKLRRLSTGISLTGESTPRLRAQILACGELMSTTLGAAYLRTQKLEASWQDARKLLRSTPFPHQRSENAYLSAVCSFGPDEELQQNLEPHRLVVTQGFIASDEQGHTVLLGRGGSDTSAAYLASKLEAQRLEIWTDVAGLYTADPRQIPNARLLRNLDYQEAQELATVGAKVLHPRCLGPCREGNIPLQVRCTQMPSLEGTRIATRSGDPSAAVKAVSAKRGVVLISMDGLGMWQEVGFLAEAFACFQRHGLSVDLVTTSETNVTVTLDEPLKTLGQQVLSAMMSDLSRLCRPRLIQPCATVSLVGRRIRSILHRLGPALEVFEDEKVHMVCQSASDLNLTFVVDEDQAERLVSRLHNLLFSSLAEDDVFGPTWQQQSGPESKPSREPRSWWSKERKQLLEIAAQQSPVYVYQKSHLQGQARALTDLKSIDRVFYAMKANNNADVLKVLRQEGLGFECVSPGELRRLAELFPDLKPDELLYTPNFASVEDYRAGFEAGARVTLDNLSPLETWPELFQDKELFLRLDPGRGGGHHRHVRTAGPLSKFGIAVDQLPRLKHLLRACRARVVGLHAHSGSGIKEPESWVRVAHYLSEVANSDFPEVRVLDLGGGLGVSEKPGHGSLNLKKLDRALQKFRTAHPNFELWLEPGRFLVSAAGVLLTTVTQTKSKGDRRFVGVNTGFNTLIRPALYGAYHHIVNLTRYRQPAAQVADVVGPICETGDVLGHDRKLPECKPGDVLLIATAGAYGRSMSSRYNLREPASEVMI